MENQEKEIINIDNQEENTFSAKGLMYEEFGSGLRFEFANPDEAELIFDVLKGL